VSGGGGVARITGTKNAYKMLIVKPEEKRKLGILGADQRITLKWTLHK
jgi:hypothetical protein